MSFKKVEIGLLPRKRENPIFCSASDLESVLQEVELAVVLLDRGDAAEVLRRSDAGVRPQRPDLAQLLRERVRVFLIVSLNTIFLIRTHPCSFGLCGQPHRGQNGN